MGTYEEYLKRIKRTEIAPDYGKMYSSINARIGGETVVRRVEFSFAGAMAALVLVAGLYFGNMTFAGNNEDVFRQYVFQRESVSGDQIMGYVYQN